MDDVEGLKAAALVAVRQMGCTCDPDIRGFEPAPGLFVVSVAHDDGCPTLRFLSAANN